MNTEIQDRLNGRVACWHAYLNGMLSVEECQRAALAFWGYDGVEALEAHYPALSDGDKDIGIHDMPEALAGVLRDPEGEVSDDQFMQMLRDLLAYMREVDASDLLIDFHEKNLQWTIEGHTHFQKIGAHAQALFLKGMQIDEEALRSLQAAEGEISTVFGDFRLHYSQGDGDKIRLSLWQMSSELVEYAGGPLQDAEKVIPYLGALLSQRRSDRTPDAAGLPRKHQRVRS